MTLSAVAVDVGAADVVFGVFWGLLFVVCLLCVVHFVLRHVLFGVSCLLFAVAGGSFVVVDVADSVVVVVVVVVVACWFACFFVSLIVCCRLLLFAVVVAALVAPKRTARNVRSAMRQNALSFLERGCVVSRRQPSCFLQAPETTQSHLTHTHTHAYAGASQVSKHKALFGAGKKHSKQHLASANNLGAGKKHRRQHLASANNLGTHISGRGRNTGGNI